MENIKLKDEFRLIMTDFYLIDSYTIKKQKKLILQIK